MSRAILSGGFAAGILDITAAFIHAGVYGRSPLWVLQYIVSGLSGSNAYQGGLLTAALGLVLHFFIAFVATIVYYVASRKLEFLVRQPIICGVLYGIAVYLFMYAIVKPLSAIHSTFSFSPAVILPGLLIHVFCIGLPISLAIRWSSK